MAYAFGSIGYDTTFELSEFNEPRIRSEIETLKDVVLFILFSKPGQYPSLPMLGLDIQSTLYSTYDTLSDADLQNKIIEQCSMLGVYFQNNAVMVKKVRYKNQPSLIIQVSGTEAFPPNYKHDKIASSNKYLIGITYDDLNKMIYNVNSSSN